MIVPALSARDGYRLWASHYAEETAVSALEDAEVRALAVSVEGRRLLDVGCGVGRRLSQSGASIAVGVDLVPEMLVRAAGGRWAMGDGRRATSDANTEITCAAADVRSLPFDDASFDVLWCRLVLGHVRDVGAAYRELGRVCANGGVVIVSDVHTAAVAAGHRRTFRDEAGVLHELEHYAYALDDHRQAARGAALELDAHRVGVVGPVIQHFYIEAGREDAYAAQFGLPLVSVMSFAKSGVA